MNEHGKLKWKSIRRRCPQLARARAVMKVHKMNMPARAIVSQSRDVTSTCSKMIARILNCMVVKMESYVENGCELKWMLKDVEMKRRYRMMSVDVIALYPSIFDSAQESIGDCREKAERIR